MQLRPEVQRRVLLVALTWIGGLLGWLVLPWLRSTLASLMEHGDLRAAFATFMLVGIYYVLARNIVDMCTDIRDWRLRERPDPLEGRLKFVNGRVAWAPALLLLVWLPLETWAAVALLFGLVNHLNHYGDQGGLVTIAGFAGAATAIIAIVWRNAEPLFPLPYRWLGLSRYATPEEQRTWRWPWSRNSPR